jgi:hypothetical protein
MIELYSPVKPSRTNYNPAVEKKKIIMDSVNVQIYKIDIGKLIFVKKKY